jgi:hypothetical protein
MINLGGGIVGAGDLRPINWVIVWAAILPISPKDTVVRGGKVIDEVRRSSNPTREMSSGIRKPRL